MFLISMRNLFIFILVLGSAVLIHELAHLLAAVLGGVKIKEIGLGLPPRLAKLRTLGNTELTLNWIPLGGFVRPLGEFQTEEPGGFAASSAKTRVGILLSGSTGNLLAGFLILTLAYMLGAPANDLVRILEVFPNSPAKEAGLLAGDLIYLANDVPVGDSSTLRTLFLDNVGSPVNLGIQREDEVLEISLTPLGDRPEEMGAAGFVSMGAIIRYPISDAVFEAAHQIMLQIRETGNALVGLVTGGTSEGEARVAGPIGLKQASDWALENSIEWEAWFPILYLSSIINVGLGLTNLLPFPALDGGRIAFVLLENLRGKPINVRVEKIVHAGGLILLLTLMLALSIKDILDPLF